jgi:hypothetical protein
MTTERRVIMVLHLTTADLLREVRDLGRRLAGMNTQLPAADAHLELCDCAEILEYLLVRVEFQIGQEAGDENAPPFGLTEGCCDDNTD